jgi:hypothetical protein
LARDPLPVPAFPTSLAKTQSRKERNFVTFVSTNSQEMPFRDRSLVQASEGNTLLPRWSVSVFMAWASVYAQDSKSAGMRQINIALDVECSHRRHIVDDWSRADRCRLALVGHRTRKTRVYLTPVSSIPNIRVLSDAESF